MTSLIFHCNILYFFVTIFSWLNIIFLLLPLVGDSEICQPNLSYPVRTTVQLIAITSSMSKTDPNNTIMNTYREWLPGVMAVAVFMAIGITAERAIIHYLYWYRLLSLMSLAANTAAFCIAILTSFRFMHLQTDYDLLSRIMVTVFFMIVAVKIGCGYAHLCEAGSDIIMSFVLLGSPALTGAIVFTVKRRGLAYFIATFILVIIWLLARPYLDWVHGN